MPEYREVQEMSFYQLWEQIQTFWLSHHFAWKPDVTWAEDPQTHTGQYESFALEALTLAQEKSCWLSQAC